MENCSKEERNPEELVDIQGYTPQKTIGHSNVHTEGQQEQRPPDRAQPPKGTAWQAEDKPPKRNKEMLPKCVMLVSGKPKLIRS